MEFGRILKELRKKNDYTQGQLAKELNLGHSAISMYENGERFPEPETLIKISKIFDVDINYLFGIMPKPILRLTPHETKVMNAYRNQPDMQPAVDKLLGVTMDGYVTVYTAANSESNHKHTITRIPEDKWNEIENEPNTDEELM